MISVRKNFEALLESFKKKSIQRCCDKRLLLLQATKLLKDWGLRDGNIIQLLSTLCEIQRIIYLFEKDRIAKNVLRFNLVCFKDS